MSLSFKLYTNFDLTIENTIQKIVEDIELNKPKEILFLSPGEYETPFKKTKLTEKLESILIENNLNFYHLTTGEPTEEDIDLYPTQNFHLLFWPNADLHFTHLYMSNFDLYKNFNTDRKNKIDNLYFNYNNQPRLHRCMLMDKLVQNGLDTYGNSSWNMLTNEYDFKFWEQKITPINEKYTQGLVSEYYPFHIEFTSLFGLTTETTLRKIFVSEKTFKLLLTQTPFLCLGAKNQNTILKKYGFKLYDELFDYSFDSDDLLENRINGVISNIQNIKNKNYKELYDSIFDKLVYNRNRALEIIENDTSIPNKLIEFYRNNKQDFINTKTGYPEYFFSEIFKNKI
jgi:hypothetical protein